jgi:hypothetical protein
MIQGLNAQPYYYFLENGGEHKVILNKTDICKENFEEHEGIKENIEIGFELPPSPVLAASPGDRAMVYHYGKDWDRAVIFVYGQGGKIIYRKIDEDKFEATLTFEKNRQPSKIKADD